MKVDWLIIGAGLTGATMAERIVSQRGETVLIVDQRDHIAGNAWDEYNSHGILEHKYGPHIFHTKPSSATLSTEAPRLQESFPLPSVERESIMAIKRSA